ncbi:MAG TPA: NADH-ubiquinone oxidoreductase-F iron-sulfur binding region domain-containing protein [Actinomycetes bacterium]|nr:NADH-ubiquinone oxidoreductase-F iron-sulfur binding region domain-containing protein [Actinomycetes bacterium]
MPLLDLVPRSFGEYEAAGGGRGLQTALAAWPQAVIQEVANSGLRGRGGAGFPTGDKWRSVRAVGAGPRFAVCNAAEGEPATFKDRLLLRTNPYQVLEGLAIAAYAVGAERAYVGLKQAFAPEAQALGRALEEMRDADALGGVAVEIVLGPDLYLFGEETGLEEAIEGRLPLPRVARPFMQGLFAKPPEDNPTLVNNLETLANVPHILADGPDWLRANGTERAPGTMLFTVCGDVRREGVFELPLGTPLRYLVEELAGGPPQGRALKSIFPGASNAVVLPAQLEVPMDFDSLRQAGSGLGAAGFAVFDETACMVRAAHRYSRFLYVESCGQCPACKLGTGEVTDALRTLEAAHGSERDVERVLVQARGSTGGQKCALPTGESLLMQSLVQLFGDEFAGHVGRPCPLPRELPFHKIVDWDAEAGRFAYDLAYADKQPDWTDGP